MFRHTYERMLYESRFYIPVIQLDYIHRRYLSQWFFFAAGNYMYARLYVMPVVILIPLHLTHFHQLAPHSVDSSRGLSRTQTTYPLARAHPVIWWSQTDCEQDRHRPGHAPPDDSPRHGKAERQVFHRMRSDADRVRLQRRCHRYGSR